MGSLVYVPRLNASVKVCKGFVLWGRGFSVWRQSASGGTGGVGEGGRKCYYCCTQEYCDSGDHAPPVTGHGRTSALLLVTCWHPAK